jgi:hypothetical protein
MTPRSSAKVRWLSPDYRTLYPQRYNTFFFYFVCEAIGIAATPGLLCQPRVIVKMIVEKQMKCRLAGETEVLGENLPQRHFCPSQKPTWPDPGLNTGRRGGKPATNRLSYGAAEDVTLHNNGCENVRAHIFVSKRVLTLTFLISRQF